MTNIIAEISEEVEDIFQDLTGRCVCLYSGCRRSGVNGSGFVGSKVIRGDPV